MAAGVMSKCKGATVQGAGADGSKNRCQMPMEAGVEGSQGNQEREVSRTGREQDHLDENRKEARASRIMSRNDKKQKKQVLS